MTRTVTRSLESTVLVAMPVYPFMYRIVRVCTCTKLSWQSTVQYQSSWNSTPFLAKFCVSGRNRTPFMYRIAQSVPWNPSLAGSISRISALEGCLDGKRENIRRKTRIRMGKIKEKETRKDWKKNRKKVLLFCDPWFRPKSTIYESNFYFCATVPLKDHMC